MTDRTFSEKNLPEVPDVYREMQELNGVIGEGIASLLNLSYAAHK
jgi:hypothetical protein